MGNETFAGALKGVPVFDGLTDAQINGLTQRLERVMFRIGQPIVKAGDTGDGAYLIIFGDAEIRGKAELTPEQRDVPTGSLIGELAMLIDMEHGATIVAKSAVRALKITRSALYTMMERDSDLAAHFVDKINSRLKALIEDIRSIEHGLMEVVPLVPVPQPLVRPTFLPAFETAAA